MLIALIDTKLLCNFLFNNSLLSFLCSHKNLHTNLTHHPSQYSLSQAGIDGLNLKEHHKNNTVSTKLKVTVDY